MEFYHDFHGEWPIHEADQISIGWGQDGYCIENSKCWNERMRGYVLLFRGGYKGQWPFDFDSKGDMKKRE